MVKLKEDGRWYKHCPSCNEEQSYLRKNYAIWSEQLQKLCKKCSNRDPKNNAHKGYYKGVLRASFVHKYKTNAETRGIEWNISFDYLAELLIDQDFKCALSGETLDAMQIQNNCSLDRIDSSQGYVEGNVQWTTSMVNMCKQSYTQADFISMCVAVSSNREKW